MTRLKLIGGPLDGQVREIHGSTLGLFHFSNQNDEWIRNVYIRDNESMRHIPVSENADHHRVIQRIKRESR